MEFAVKWMYSVDGSLIMPWDDKLVSLMNTDEFRDIVDADLWKRMEFHTKSRKYCCPCRKEDKQGTGQALSGKPVYFHGILLTIVMGMPIIHTHLTQRC